MAILTMQNFVMSVVKNYKKKNAKVSGCVRDVELHLWIMAIVLIVGTYFLQVVQCRAIKCLS